MSAPAKDGNDSLTQRGVAQPLTDEGMSREGLRAVLLAVLVCAIFFWMPLAWAAMFLAGLPLGWFVR